MKIASSLLFLILLLCLSSGILANAANGFTGKVISVADGDTITVLNKNQEQNKVRLSSVDCPESDQAFGKKAITVPSYRISNLSAR